MHTFQVTASKANRPTLVPRIGFFFFNDTATTEIYTLSLHDALPISRRRCCGRLTRGRRGRPPTSPDRKSTRLNSSHQIISYAVFCLKKKINHQQSRISSTYKYLAKSIASDITSD